MKFVKILLMGAFLCVGAFAQNVDIVDPSGETVSLTQPEIMQLTTTRELVARKVRVETRQIVEFIAFLDNLDPVLFKSQAEKDKVDQAKTVITALGRRLQKKYLEAIVTARTVRQQSLDKAIVAAQTKLNMKQANMDVAQAAVDALPGDAEQAAIDDANAKLTAAQAALVTAQSALSTAQAMADTFRNSEP